MAGHLVLMLLLTGGAVLATLVAWYHKDTRPHAERDPTTGLHDDVRIYARGPTDNGKEAERPSMQSLTWIEETFTQKAKNNIQAKSEEKMRKPKLKPKPKPKRKRPERASPPPRTNEEIQQSMDEHGQMRWEKMRGRTYPRRKPKMRLLEVGWNPEVDEKGKAGSSATGARAGGDGGQGTSSKGGTAGDGKDAPQLRLDNPHTWGNPHMNPIPSSHLPADMWGDPHLNPIPSSHLPAETSSAWDRSSLPLGSGGQFKGRLVSARFEASSASREVGAGTSGGI